MVVYVWFYRFPLFSILQPCRTGHPGQSVSEPSQPYSLEQTEPQPKRWDPLQTLLWRTWGGAPPPFCVYGGVLECCRPPAAFLFRTPQLLSWAAAIFRGTPLSPLETRFRIGVKASHEDALMVPRNNLASLRD